MAFFQQSVLDKYLRALNREKLKASYAQFKQTFHNPAIQENIRQSKEEQYQRGFLRDLFVNVLGYTLNPQENFNLTTEYKNVKDSKKADGAILIGEQVKAVIELKGTDTTDLNKVEEQAFGYKNNQPDCTYVIISNFEKLRFYIDNAIEHIEFNLFSLTENEFALLWLCLAYENIASDLPKKIKTASVSREDEITQKLYKDYSQFKQELFRNIVKLNPEHNELELFKKSQKLLDRFLFIFFAEDRNLLPPNSMRKILHQWKQLQELDAYTPLYNRFKKYFGYMNTGFKGKTDEVFAYNGGLFKPDAILDTIVIDDTVLYEHTLNLSNYDYASEVDVNILGHIFEHSLNEIEEVKANLEGKEIDKTQTKRKKDGIYYTPKYITKYIVENTVGKLCDEKKQELGIVEEEYLTERKRNITTKKPLLEKLESYRDWLLKLTICDPACGSGAFLNQALDFLIKEHHYIDELIAKITGASIVFEDVEISILENNLFGVDLNEESVEIAKLSLWLRTARPQRKLNDLNNNIKCGNSLIDDPEVAGDKAFNWKTEFPHVFADGGFDVVIGNPPYVRQELVKDYSVYFENTFTSYSGKADLFVYFYEKAYSICKNKGIVSFISSGKFFEASYGKPLIDFLVKNTRLIEVVDFKDLDIFKGVSAYPLILTFKNEVVSNYSFRYEDASRIKIENLSDILEYFDFKLIDIQDFVKNDYKFIDYRISNLIDKLEKNSAKLAELNLLPLVGVKTGYNDGFLNINSKYSKEYIFGRNIKKYSNIQAENKIFFPYVITDGKYELIDSDDEELLLLEERDKLEKRAIIKDGLISGTKKWFEFQQINRMLDFDNEYIIYPNVSLGNNFTISKGRVVDMTCFIIPSNSKYLLSILNSKLVAFLMEIYAISRRGGYLEYKVQYLSKIPIKDISLDLQQPFIEKADQMLLLNKELQEVSQKFIRMLERRFEIDSIPNRLQEWHTLSYDEFLKELSKKKIKLSLAQESEWEDFFRTEKEKATAIAEQIATTDREIDQMVYKLYNLTEEEIEIVEKG